MPSKKASCSLCSTNLKKNFSLPLREDVGKVVVVVVVVVVVKQVSEVNESKRTDGRVMEILVTAGELNDPWNPGAMDGVPPFVMTCSCS